MPRNAGPLPLKVVAQEHGKFVVATNQETFYALTYCEKDARAIAAGPDLLAALKVAAEYTNIDEVDMAKIRKAIAKAEGGK